jgi:hypothetical protein
MKSTRVIESATIQKLNCMYLAARKISYPTIEYMLRTENEMKKAQQKEMEED